MSPTSTNHLTVTEQMAAFMRFRRATRPAPFAGARYANQALVLPSLTKQQ
jgi:hypothetical protein